MTEGPAKAVTPLRYSELGRTGLRVSALCFGTLALGPAQYDLPLEKAGFLLQRAWRLGVNFFDTAELYGTYRHLRTMADLPGVVVASTTRISTVFRTPILNRRKRSGAFSGFSPAINWIHSCTSFRLPKFNAKLSPTRLPPSG